MATNLPVNMDTLITVKVQIEGSNRKFKLPLRDLLPTEFQQKLRSLLSIPDGQLVIFERFSDSAAAYVKLDPENVQVYKTLMRAAKAKLKLRIRATISEASNVEDATTISSPAPVTPPEAPKQRPISIASPLTSQVSRDTSLPLPYRQSMYNIASSRAASTTSVKPQSPVKPENKDDVEEAPLPKPFGFGLYGSPKLPSAWTEHYRSAQTKDAPAISTLSPWQVFCNNCDNAMANEHYHCSICDDGDFDLCSTCVGSGILCSGQGHWLIKRFIKDGKVISSVTEKIAPKPRAKPEVLDKSQPTLGFDTGMPGAFTEEKKVEPEEEEPTRTCNSCIKVYDEKEFVTCIDCEDFDLCLPCHIDNKHNHHPGHSFEPASKETSMNALAEALCGPGRHMRHNAICDGCDQFIYGIRHKCLNCPDWDYCSKCVKSAKFIHPVHRFVAIYDPLPEARSTPTRHYGIYCDGPLCKDRENQTYIEGVRYKCAVCHDTDFCASCEAVPNNRHNRTHPLIKFKTPVRNVSVTTMGEDKNGATMATMGDQFQRKSVSTETLPLSSSNASTQVRTVADLKPAAARPVAKQLNIKDLLSEPVEENIKAQALLADPAAPAPSKSDTESEPKEVAADELDAHFVRDSIADGTKVNSGSRFLQVWTLRNPGPHAWPAGCSVRYVGGDNMLNVDENTVTSACEINEATESNVIGRKVEVGEEVSFCVCMKAPNREGTAISYWRLKAADGTPFGHRLWCHIEVKTGNELPAVAFPVPGASAKQGVPGDLSQDYSAQLQLLEAQNKARLDVVRAQQAAFERHADSRKKLADAEKRHAELRAEALENMRRTAALIDSDLKTVTGGIASMELGVKEDLASKAEPKPEPQSPTSQPAVTVPYVQASTRATVESAPASPVHNSAMIFPQLDKESPVSSTYEQAPDTIAAPPSEAPTTKTEELEIFEDAESVEFFEESDSDGEGFMTDEEYDILDASDEEMV